MSPLLEFCFDGFYDCRLFGVISVFHMYATCNMSIGHNCGNIKCSSYTCNMQYEH